MTPKPLTDNSLSVSGLSYCHSSFTHRNGRVIVEMIDPPTRPDGKEIPINDGGRYSGGTVEDFGKPDPISGQRGRRAVGFEWTPPTWAKLWDSPPDGFTEPVEILGNYCPATFRVHGLPYAMTFRTGVSVGSNDAANLEDRTRVVITTMTFEGPSIERKLLARIPTALLLDHAIHASTFIATAYPPNYKTTLGGVIRLDSGPSGTVIPHTLITERGKEALRTLKGEKPRGRRKASDAWNSDAMVERVAKLWHECPDDYVGGRSRFISDRLDADGTVYHESRYPMIVRLGRNKGLIPEVNPRYNYRKKETKRGKK